MSSSAESSRGAFAIVSIATIIAGAGGYAITTVAARLLGAEQYAEFGAFWGLLYLVVGALAGFQQEFSRVVLPGESAARDLPRVATFVAASAGVVAVVAVVAAVAVAGFGIGLGPGTLGAFVVGAAAYVPVAVLTGVLYGVGAWRPLAVVIVLDVALRLLTVSLVGLLGGGPLEAAWATVIPLPIVAVTALLLVRRRRRAFVVDASTRELAANVGRTVGAGVGTAALVSGFPLFIGLAAGTQAFTGSLVYALVLLRAPLVVGVLALQSYLVVRLRGDRRPRARVFRLSAVILATAVALSVAVWFWGADVVVLLAGAEYRQPAWLLAALTLVSASTGVLAITGAAVLARADHTRYVVGWTVAAVVALVLLFLLPVDTEVAVVVALGVGPLAGVVAHMTGLARSETDRPGQPAENA